MFIESRARLSSVAAGLVASLAGAVLLATPAGAAATTRYVATTGTDTGTCTSRAHPCKTVEYAVDHAAAGDTVSIGAGRFQSETTIDESLTLVGAGAGKTVLAALEAPVLDVTSAGALVSVRSMTLSGSGSADAGIEIRAGSATLDSVTVTDAELGVQVGLGDGEGATLTVDNSHIDANLHDGIAAIASTVAVTGSSVSGNGVDADADPTEGAGVAVFDPARTAVTTTTLAGNAEVGIYAVTETDGDDARQVHAAAAPTTTVTRSTISKSGEVGLAFGPGITASVSNSTISGTKGAGVYTEASTTTITDSTVTGTSPAQAEDGGIESSGGIVALPADVGGGGGQGAAPVRTLFAPRTLTLRVRGGVRQLRVSPKATDEATVIDVAGSIDAGNTAPDCRGSIADGGYDLSSDKANSCAFSAAKHSLSKTNPELGTLRDNGGPTETVEPASGSPALNVIPAGSAGCTSGAVDQRGVVRPQPAGGRCDIGAVEVAAALPPIVIHPAALPDGTVGTGYSQTLTATGGKGHGFVWSLAPGSTLPAGLSLSSGGVISGTPGKAGTFSVTVSVNDPTTKTYRLVIHPLAVSSSAAPTSTAPTSTVNSNSAAGQSTAAIANTGTDVSDLTGFGVLLLVAGAAVAVGAGVGQRRRGRHQTH